MLIWLMYPADVNEWKSMFDPSSEQHKNQTIAFFRRPSQQQWSCRDGQLNAPERLVVRRKYLIPPFISPF